MTAEKFMVKKWLVTVAVVLVVVFVLFVIGYSAGNSPTSYGFFEWFFNFKLPASDTGPVIEKTTCGNGVCESGELTTCVRDCVKVPGRIPEITRVRCGNGILDSGEQCDDGNRVSGDGCALGCRLECPIPAHADIYCPELLVCGNGIITVGEECDDGDLNSDIAPNACRNDCTLPYCGDEVTDSAYGEQCDGEGPFIRCTSDCRFLSRPSRPCVCDEKGCEPNPDPWSDPHSSVCVDRETPWTKLLGPGDPAETGRGIAVDSLGTIYTISDGSDDNVIIRQIDTCGNVVWENSVPFSSVSDANQISVGLCGDSYIHVTTSFGESVIHRFAFDGEELSFVDAFMSSPLIGGRALGRGIFVDRDFVVAVGSVERDEDTSYDLWVRKYDLEGNILWESFFNGNASLEDYGGSVAVDEFGNIYVEGESTYYSGDENILVDWSGKYSSDGELLWSLYLTNRYGGIIGVDLDNNLLFPARDNIVFVHKHSSSDGRLLERYYYDDYGISDARQPWQVVPLGATGSDDTRIVVVGSDDIYAGWSKFWTNVINPETNTLILDDVVGNILTVDGSSTNLDYRTPMVAVDLSENIYVIDSVKVGASFGTTIAPTYTIIRKYVPDPLSEGYLSDSWPE